jgi:intergrase/recombinase
VGLCFTVSAYTYKTAGDFAERVTICEIEIQKHESAGDVEMRYIREKLTEIKSELHDLNQKHAKDK